MHFTILFILLFNGPLEGIENRAMYAASTPANEVVKAFIGIPINDSVDFIRWKLTMDGGRYEMNCAYGISQANTNGFVGGGKTVVIKGTYERRNNYYHFLNGKRILKAIEVNADILHLLNTNNSFMNGNGGWSYTLNSTNPSGSAFITVQVSHKTFKDSVAFEGRTPCGIPGLMPAGTPCYKLKWYLVFYADEKSEVSGTFRVLGTRWRDRLNGNGRWQIIDRVKGQTIYRLSDQHGREMIYLSRLAENILAFTDSQGRLLVGDADFSYTLNRR